jgi:hypothetical protein
MDRLLATHAPSSSPSGLSYFSSDLLPERIFPQVGFSLMGANTNCSSPMDSDASAGPSSVSASTSPSPSTFSRRRSTTSEILGAGAILREGILGVGTGGTFPLPTPSPMVELEPRRCFSPNALDFSLALSEKKSDIELDPESLLVSRLKNRTQINRIKPLHHCCGGMNRKRLLEFDPALATKGGKLHGCNLFSVLEIFLDGIPVSPLHEKNPHRDVLCVRVLRTKRGSKAGHIPPKLHT